MNLSGKSCLITGANSGLGFAAAKKFAKLGAKVVLVCRDRDKGQNALESIRKEYPDSKAELMICNLASLASIRDFITQFKEKYSSLEILFNNAAVMKSKRTFTLDGLETMFQVNYLSAFLITNSLIDLLKISGSSRIINIAVPPDNIRLDFEDLQVEKQYSMFDAFFRSKLCLLLYSLELSERLSDLKISVNLTDPGPGKFRSNLVKEAGVFGRLIDIFAKSADQAAETIFFLASSDEVKDITGKVFLGKKARKLAPYWRDKTVRERLFTLTESLLMKVI